MHAIWLTFSPDVFILMVNFPWSYLAICPEMLSIIQEGVMTHGAFLAVIDHVDNHKEHMDDVRLDKKLN